MDVDELQVPHRVRAGRVVLLLFAAALAALSVTAPAHAAPGSTGWGGFPDAVLLTYETEGPAGSPTTATGILIPPEGSPPPGGWPVVAWDHGTMGLAEHCGLTESGGPYDTPIMRLFHDAGYAVVAADYLGLGPGATTVHPYLHSRTEATATIDAVRAARATDPRLSPTWAVVGVSQGGHAALATGHLAETYAPELDFRGTVALAPPSNLDRLVPPVGGPGIPAVPGTDAVVGQIAAALAGMRIAQPDFDLDAYLTPAGRDLLQRLASRCVLEWPNEVRGAALGSLLDQPLASGEFSRRFADYTAVAVAGYTAPIMIGHGVEDAGVPYPLTLALAAEMSAAGTQFDLHTYHSSHDDIAYVAWPDVARFLDRVFA